MDTQNYYELLGVDPTASMEEIRQALSAMRTRFRRLTSHPDRVKARAGEDRLDLLERVEKTLLNASARIGYDRDLAQGQSTGAFTGNSRSETDSKSRIEGLRIDMRYAWEQKNWNSLSKFAQSMTRLKQDDSEAWEMLAAAYLWGDWDRNRRREAMHAISQARRYGPTDEERVLLIEYALACGSQDNLQAMETAQQLMALKPNNLDYIVAFIESRWDAGQRAEALRDVDNAVAAYPNKPKIRCLQAELRLKEASQYGFVYKGASYIDSKQQVKAIRESLSKISDAYLLPDDLMKIYRANEYRVRMACSRPVSWGKIVRFIILMIVSAIVIGTVLGSVLNIPSHSQNMVVRLFAELFLMLATLVGSPVLSFYACFPPSWKIAQKEFGK